MLRVFKRGNEIQAKAFLAQISAQIEMRMTHDNLRALRKRKGWLSIYS